MGAQVCSCKIDAENQDQGNAPITDSAPASARELKSPTFTVKVGSGSYEVGSSGGSSSGPCNSINDVTLDSSSLDTWNFNPLLLSQSSLEQVSATLLLRHAADETPTNTIKDFVSKTLNGYLPNPYHNRFHAVDVTQALYRCGTLMSWEKLFVPKLQFSLLVSTIAHDLGHPGVANPFLVATKDELAYRYNDISPLENMHCANLFEILQQERFDIFAGYSESEFREFRKLIVDMILHTDMVHHTDMLEGMKKLYEANKEVFDSGLCLRHGTDEQVEIFKLPENKKLIMRMLVHGADLLNPARHWACAKDWANNLVQEFFKQGDRERALGMPVMPLNNRETLNIADSQLGYYLFMYAPFLASWVNLVPCWQELAENLASNANNWADILALGGKVDEECTEIKAATVAKDARVEKILSKFSKSVIEPEKKVIPSKACQKDDVSAEGNSSGPLALRNTTEPPEETFVRQDLPQQKQRPFRMVREVRRWWEAAPVQEAGLCETGDDSATGREIVVLYVMPRPALMSQMSQDSEGFADILASALDPGNTSTTPTTSQKDAKDARDDGISIPERWPNRVSKLAVRIPSLCDEAMPDQVEEIASMPHLAECTRVPGVPVLAADNVTTAVDAESFDTVLHSLLELQFNKDREVFGDRRRRKVTPTPHPTDFSI